MNKEDFLTDLIYDLEHNIKELGDFILEPAISEKGTRYSFGIEVSELKERFPEHLELSRILMEAHNKNLIEIACLLVKKDIVSDYSVVQLTSEHYNKIKKDAAKRYDNNLSM